MNAPPIPPVPQQPSTGGDRSALVPKLGVEPGDTTIDDKLAVEVEVACHREMHRLTAAVRRRLATHLEFVSSGEPDGATERPASARAQVFFLDNALRLALDLKPSVEIQLANLKQAYSGAAATARDGLTVLQVAPPAPDARARTLVAFPAVTAAMAVADAAVAIVGALRTDTRYLGRQVVIPEQAFGLALAHEWEASPSVDFHYPTLFVPPVAGTSALMQGLVDAIDAAIEARNSASQAISNLLTRVGQLAATDPTFPLAKASLDSARDQFQAAEAVFDDVSVKLTKADDKTGLTQLQLLARAAFVTSIANAAAGRTFYLFAQVVAAGGAFRVTRNLFTMLVGDGLQHAGGCVVTFGLFDDTGRLLASDTIGSRSAYEDSRPAIAIG